MLQLLWRVRRASPFRGKVTQMAIYDLYSVRATSLQDARNVVEGLLSICFEERRSSYHRGPYFALGTIGDENFELKANLDAFEDVVAEDEFPDEPFLLYVNNTSRSEVLARALTAPSDIVVFLRHENL